MSSKLNIGRIPVSKGEYVAGNSYDRLWQVTYLGSTYQSKIDGNTSAPAEEVDGVVRHINTDKWLCIADATNAVNMKPVTDEVVGSWGYSKTTGTYNKPEGGIPKSDLSSEVQASLNKANNAIQDISGKVDKVAGKGLSTEDFTTALKEKLDGLSNYNDAAVRKLITDIQAALDALTGVEDTTQAIDTMNEIVDFLEQYKNTDSLASVLSTLESTIHTWVENKGYLTEHQDLTSIKTMIELAKSEAQAAKTEAAGTHADAQAAREAAESVEGKVALAEASATAAEASATKAAEHLAALKEAVKELPDGQAVSEKVAEHTVQLSELEESVHTEDSSKYIRVEVDAERKIVYAITKNGNKEVFLSTDYINGLKSRGKDVLTEHQDLSGYATKEDLNTLEDLNTFNELTDSNKYVKVEIDSEGKILSFVGTDGVRHECIDTIYEGNVTSPNIKKIEDDVKKIHEEIANVTLYPEEKWLTIVKNLTRTGIDSSGYPQSDILPLNLLWMSDVHNEDSAMRRFLEFYRKYKQYINDSILTGDLVRDKWTNNISAITSLDGFDKVLFCIGNHDITSYNGESPYVLNNVPLPEAFARYFKNWEGVVYPEGAAVAGKMYWYKDYIQSKIRLISLDCFNYANTEQEQWFADILEDARIKGYAVICAQHMPSGVKNGFNTPFNGLDTYKIDYHHGETSQLNAVDVFINNGGVFICWIWGHVHDDHCGVLTYHPNQIYIAIGGALTNDEIWQDTYRIEGTDSIDLFNILSIEPKDKLIRVVRVGAEYDRHGRHRGEMIISYDSKNIIYNR